MPPADMGWQGDMRHLPMDGGLPTSSRTTPYLVIKQDNNADTFLVSAAEIPHIDQQARVTEVTAREIGAWVPDETDGPTSPRSDHTTQIAPQLPWAAGRSPVKAAHQHRRH